MMPSLKKIAFRRNTRRGSVLCNRRWREGRPSSPPPRAPSGIMFTAYISVSREFLKIALELFQPFLLRKLEEQLKETQVAKDELVAQQQELHEMMIRFANLL